MSSPKLELQQSRAGRAHSDRAKSPRLVSTRSNRLSSTQNFFEEHKHRHQKDSCIIHPSDSFAVFWEWIILVLLIYTIFVLPLRLAFEHDDAKWGFYLDLTVDGLFLFDILVNFNLGFRSTLGPIVLERRLIMRRYVYIYIYILAIRVITNRLCYM